MDELLIVEKKNKLRQRVFSFIEDYTNGKVQVKANSFEQGVLETWGIFNTLMDAKEDEINELRSRNKELVEAFWSGQN